MNDFDRSVIKNLTELHNRPPERLVLGWARLPNNSIGFAGIKLTTRTSIAMLACVWVRFRRNERENLSIQAKPVRNKSVLY